MEQISYYNNSGFIFSPSINIAVKFLPFHPVFMLLYFAIQSKGISIGRVPIFLAFLIRFILFEPLRLAELIIFERKIHRHQLQEDPIFILGHWRSGTSHLQQLLSKATNYGTSTIFQCLFADTYCLSQRWLKPIFDKLCKRIPITYSFQRIPLRLDLPAELDPALCIIMSSYAYTWGHLFPCNFQYWSQMMVLSDEKKATGWIKDYDYLIKKLSFFNKKRLIIKSPGDTARLHLLLKQYPNAKFIYIHRSPIPVFHSNRYLWSVIQKENSFQKITQARIDQHIIDSYRIILSQYLKKRAKIDDDALMEIRFEALLQTPLTTLAAIFNQLKLGVPDQQAVRSYIQQTSAYNAKAYKGEKSMESLIRRAWAFSFEHWPEANSFSSSSHPSSNIR